MLRVRSILSIRKFWTSESEGRLWYKSSIANKVFSGWKILRLKKFIFKRKELRVLRQV